ncbi:MAG: tetratricopeptide repeat protein [Candidatus Solibacter usitatus]|nr:tetratricopeptide repeat protein [Candidatus Solibacter usitatus]
MTFSSMTLSGIVIQAMRCAAAAVLCAAISLPQTQTTPAPTTGTPTTTPGNVGTPGSTGTPGTSRPGTTSPFPSTTNPTQQQPQMEINRPIFISGKVVMEDGTPPPESVTIERVCNGNPRPEAYTDSRGRFHFQLGENQHMMADASVSRAGDFGNERGGFGGFGGAGGNSRGVSERSLMGCEIRASLPGHRSEAVNLANRRSMDNPDIGTIILRRLGNVEGLTLSATAAMAPKDAKKAYEKGRDLMRKQKLADAQKEFEKAVAAYPKYANAWSDLGIALEQQKQIEPARRAYEQAIVSDPKLVLPHVQLALFFLREKNWKDCAAESERAMKLNPFDYPQAFYFNSVANLNMQNLDAAEKSARDGIKSDTQNRYPKMRHVLGIALAQKNDVSGAMEHMKGYLSKLPFDSPDIHVVKGQITQLENMAKAAVTPAASAAQQQQQ